MAIVEEKLFIQRLKDGDREAFNQLVEQHKDAILNVCYGFVKDQTEAEDLAQEVFAEVYITIRNFRQQSSLFTWMYRIAVSKSLDSIKRKKALKRAAFFEKRVRSESAEQEMLQRSADRPDPAQELEQKQQRAFINFCISRLAETQRVAFVLSQQDGLSYREIARIMDKNLSSVESLIYRARQNLRKIMEEHYDDYF